MLLEGPARHVHFQRSLYRSGRATNVTEHIVCRYSTRVVKCEYKMLMCAHGVKSSPHVSGEWCHDARWQSEPPCKVAVEEQIQISRHDNSCARVRATEATRDGGDGEGSKTHLYDYVGRRLGVQKTNHLLSTEHHRITIVSTEHHIVHCIMDHASCKRPPEAVSHACAPPPRPARCGRQQVETYIYRMCLA